MFRYLIECLQYKKRTDPTTPSHLTSLHLTPPDFTSLPPCISPALCGLCTCVIASLVVTQRSHANASILSLALLLRQITSSPHNPLPTTDTTNTLHPPPIQYPIRPTTSTETYPHPHPSIPLRYRGQQMATNPYSSRLIVHILIGLGALVCFCFVPKYTYPHVGKEARAEKRERRASRAR
jgi:hypothetical protein